MVSILLVITCIGAATIGGVFFAFSTFVMQALGELSPAHGVAAMQRINVTVLNRWFLGAFMGTALLSAGCIVVAFLPWDGVRSLATLAAGLLYLFGTFGVTIACNVPRNDRLKGLDATSAEAAGYWAVYLREWVFWNHVRTVAAIVAAGCAALGLAA